MAKVVPLIDDTCNVRFGTDPELFIKEIKTKKIIPADTFLPSKKRKKNFDVGKLFFDGVQAEMNVTPSTCRDGFVNNIQQMLSHLEGTVNGYGVKRKYSLLATASCKVDRKLIMKADKECVIFGCEPSLNAYNRRNNVNIDGSRHMIRYAGGHVHLGCKKLSVKEANELTKVEDMVVGIPSLLLDNDSMTLRRKQFYGKAGEYRIQPHGYEYRTLSNFWLRSPMITSLVFGLARAGYMIWSKGYSDRILDLSKGNKVAMILDQSNTKEARRLYNKMRRSLVSVEGPLSYNNGLEYFEYLSRVGINRFFTKTILKEWKIKTGTWSGGSSNGWLNGMGTVLRGDQTFTKFRTEFKKKNPFIYKRIDKWDSYDY